LCFRVKVRVRVRVSVRVRVRVRVKAGCFKMRMVLASSGTCGASLSGAKTSKLERKLKLEINCIHLKS